VTAGGPDDGEAQAEMVAERGQVVGAQVGEDLRVPGGPRRGERRGGQRRAYTPPPVLLGHIRPHGGDVVELPGDERVPGFDCLEADDLAVRDLGGMDEGALRERLDVRALLRLAEGRVEEAMAPANDNGVEHRRDRRRVVRGCQPDREPRRR
jgi:hypothetical protein